MEDAGWMDPKSSGIGGVEGDPFGPCEDGGTDIGKVEGDPTGSCNRDGWDEGDPF